MFYVPLSITLRVKQSSGHVPFKLGPRNLNVITIIMYSMSLKDLLIPYFLPSTLSSLVKSLSWTCGNHNMWNKQKKISVRHLIQALKSWLSLAHWQNSLMDHFILSKSNSEKLLIFTVSTTLGAITSHKLYGVAENFYYSQGIFSFANFSKKFLLRIAWVVELMVSSQLKTTEPNLWHIPPIHYALHWLSQWPCFDIFDY